MCFITSHVFFNLTFKLTSICVLHMASTSLRLELTSHLVNLVWKLYLNASAFTDHFIRSKVLDKYISHCHIVPPRMFSNSLSRRFTLLSPRYLFECWIIKQLQKYHSSPITIYVLCKKTIWWLLLYILFKIMFCMM